MRRNPQPPQQPQNIDHHNAGDHGHHDEGAIGIIGEAAHQIGQAIAPIARSAHALGRHIPGPIHRLGEAAEVIADMVHDLGPNPVERVVCGGLTGIVRIGGTTAVTAAIVIPPAAAETVLATPIVSIPATFALGYAIQGMADAVVRPYADLTNRACHATFAWGRQQLAQPASPSAAPRQCQTSLTETRMRNNALNSFAPTTNINIYRNSPWQNTTPVRPFSYQSPFYSPYNSTNIFFNNSYNSNNSFNNSYNSNNLNNYFNRKSYWDVKSAVQNAVQKELLSYSPSALSAYSRACMELGLGYSLSLSEFRSVAATSNLISSYNSYNSGSKLRDIAKFCSEIGGVGNDVSTITDLIGSEAHAKATEYYLCLPTNEKLPFPPAFLSQISRELKSAFFKHKTLPWFSLDFSPRPGGFLYPAIHPAYQNTLIGEIIGLLDYWMKGYLNGGVFDAEFLKIWHEIGNCDEEFLKTKLIDLKKYCKQQATGVNYNSLVELEARYGVKGEKDSIHCAYDQPFMTSFRIIASQENVERNGNILVPHPTFRVEYSIDLRPDYKHYIEEYCKQHGQFPEEYQRIKHLYELFAEEIKEKMPKLPFCRDFFPLLGAINSLCYFYTTLEKMGKEPDLDALPVTHSYHFPKALPPIPIRYHRILPLDIAFGEVITQVMDSPSTESLDEVLAQLFANNRVRSLPESLDKQLTQAVLKIMYTKLATQFPSGRVEEINDEELEKIARETRHFLLQQVHQVHGGLHRALKGMAIHLDEDFQKSLVSLPLPEKIERAQELLIQHLNLLKLRWEEKPELVFDELFAEIPSTLHDELHQNFQKIAEQIKRQLQEYVTETTAHTIEKETAIMEAAVNLHLASEMKNARAELVKIAEIKNTQQKQVSELTAAVIRLQKHKISQIDSIPINARALNKVNIDNFIAATDKQINAINQDIANLNANIKKIDEVEVDIKKGIDNAPAKVAEDIALRKKKIISDIEERVQSKEFIDNFEKNVAESTAQEFKAQGIKLLNLIHEKNLEKLASFRKHVTHFTQTLLGIEPVVTHKMCKQYTHAAIGFGRELAAGRSYFVGGCGMHTPNLKTRPIAHAEDFSLAVAEACQDKDEEISTFQFQGQAYTVMRIPVIDVDHQLELEEDDQPLPQSAAQQALAAICDTGIIDESVTAELLKTVIDNSGARFMHYAAAILSEPFFKKLMAISPDEAVAQDKLGHLPIHAASVAGNDEVAASLIAHHPRQLEAQTRSGATPLILAVQYGKKAVVEQLLSLGGNVNHCLPSGLTSLYIAIQNNYPEIALLLLNSTHINVNTCLSSNMTPLHLAIESGLSALALTLVEKGAQSDIKRKTDGFAPLHCAAQQGELELLKLMVKKGASLQLALESKKTALHIAAEAGHSDVISYLIASGLSVDDKTIDGDTPLMLAIKAGHVDVARLLAQKAAVNTVNVHGQTASILAIQYGLPSVSDILIARQENPQLRDKQDYSYLYYLIRNGEYHRFGLLNKQHKIDPDQKYDGDNLLAIAARFGHFFLAYDFVDEGVKFKSKHKDLKLIHYAVISDEIGFIREWLVNHSLEEGDVSSGIHAGKSMAYFAAENGSSRCLALFLSKLSAEEIKKQHLLTAAINSRNAVVVSMVLQRWDDVNQRLDAKQNTALHLAVNQGSRELVELLLTRGSNVKLRNADNETPFHIAISQDDAYLLKRLLKLTRPKEWPKDLWQLEKTSSAIARVLGKNHKRLPVREKNEVQLANELILPELLSDESANESHVFQKAEIEELKILFQEEAFEEVADLLEQKPSLLHAFKSPLYGGLLLQCIFANVHDYSALLKQFTEESKDTPPFAQPEKVLALLKDLKVNPADFTGKYNVLKSIITAQTDKEACYRLELLAKYFPDCLASLAQDHYSSHTRYVELALKYNRLQLFEKLDEICMSSSSPTEASTFCGLHEAVLADNYLLVKSLLTRYPANLQNNKKQTPLMLAAEKGNIRIMELLIGHGALPDTRDKEGHNALFYAIDKKSEQAALFILPLLRHKNQADRQGITPLTLAAAKGILPVVRYLCEEANYSQEFDVFGRNALHHAAIAGEIKTIEYLVAHGFDINQVEMPSSPKKIKQCQKRTALHLAARFARAEAVCKLLELGADPEQTDVQGNTVCEFAVLSNDSEMLRVIEQLESYHSPEHNTKLLHAAAKSNNMEVASELVLEQINLNGVDEGGRSALHLAAITNSGDVANLLLNSGDVVVDLINQQGDTALHNAAMLGHVRMIELLVHGGADINKQNRACLTPLFIACEAGHSGAVAALIKAGADFTIPNDQGITPAQKALLNGHKEIAHSLLAAGDKSLESDAFGTLSKSIKEKIIPIQAQFLEEHEQLLKRKITVAGSLIRHGIFRLDSKPGSDEYLIPKAQTCSSN